MASDEQKQFASDLELMKNRAHTLGLHATASPQDISDAKEKLRKDLARAGA